MNKIIIFALFIGIFINQLFSDEQNLKAIHQYSISTELVQLSDWLKVLQQGLKESSEIEQIWIGGGSARAILDHLYFGKKLEMRDLDIFVVANQEVTDPFVRKIGHYLESENFGYFSQKDLRSRPRVPLDKPVLTRNQYVAGFGLHWLRSNGEILDLSVYHTKEDLDLNGIFDIDTIMIPLHYTDSLLDFAKKAEEIPYQTLVGIGTVYDRYFGYEKWLSEKINIVNWLDIEADPLLKIMRVVRTIFKNNRTTLTEEEALNFTYLLQKTKVQSPLQMTRNILKVLEDDYALQELQLLKEIGCFNHWLICFKDLDFLQLDLKKAFILTYGRGEKAALGRLCYLIQNLPNQQLRLEAIYSLMSPFDQSTLVTWMHRELCGEEKIFDESRTFNDTHLKNICRSFLLSSEEKKELFLKEINGCWSIRKGIITGFFNPVHLGHVEFFNEAISDMVLDELMIVPLIDEPHIDSPTDWKERYEMLKLIENEIEGMKVVPAHYRKKILQGEEALIRALVAEDPHVEWIRILGSDTQKNYYECGKYDQEVCTTIVVVQRADTPFYPMQKSGKKIYFKKHDPDCESHQKRHQAKNARKLAQEGKDCSAFVPKSVADYIKKHQLYQEDQKLFCVTTNDSKFHSVQKILPTCGRINVDLPLTDCTNPNAAVNDKLQKALSVGKLPCFVIEQFIKIKALSDHFIPLSDYTLQCIGVENLAKLIECNARNEATLLTLIAYAEDQHTIQILEERVHGTIDPQAVRRASYFDVNQHVHFNEKGSALERVLRKLKKENIGFLTGVFNPIHLGHLEMIKLAKEELELDRVIIIPTPATNHNEVPIEWKKRMEMAALAVQDLDGVEVLDKNYEQLLNQGTGKAIEHLMQSHPNATMWHLMGSDSFPRFVKKQAIETLPERYRVAVIKRDEITSVLPPNVVLIDPSSQTKSKKRASSVIRQLLKNGQSISSLVPSAVEKYILDHGLYQTKALAA